MLPERTEIRNDKILKDSRRLSHHSICRWTTNSTVETRTKYTLFGHTANTCNAELIKQRDCWCCNIRSRRRSRPVKCTHVDHGVSSSCTAHDRRVLWEPPYKTRTELRPAEYLPHSLQFWNKQRVNYTVLFSFREDRDCHFFSVALSSTPSRWHSTKPVERTRLTCSPPRLR